MRRKQSGQFEYTFWESGRPGDVTLEESAENLKGQRDVVKRHVGLV